jgi:uncharacterized protein YdeI (YjbR/CyaY-like superfamily)
VTGTGKLDNLERFHAGSRQELREWLMAHHLSSSGVWLVTYRRITGKPRPEYGDVVEELLCFGWVDSKLMKLDDQRAMLLCTPRRPRSQWSRSNKERVERLTEAGLMQPRGLEAVARARGDGSWDFLNDVEEMIEPQDLRDALDAVPEARRYWEAYPASYRRQVLYWLQSAKRPHTREVRVARTVWHATRNTRVEGPSRAPSDVREMESGEC